MSEGGLRPTEAAKPEGARAPGPSPGAPPHAVPPRSDKARTVEVTRATTEVRERATQEMLTRLKERFLGENLEITSRPGVLARVRFPSTAVLTICTWLRDEGTFAHCAMVAGIDWRETREVLYHLWSDHFSAYLELTTSVPASDPHLESVSPVWFGANWHEREVWEMLGIRFDHHPDLRHLLLVEGYKFNPLLKTFELHEPEELEVKARLGR